MKRNLLWLVVLFIVASCSSSGDEVGGSLGKITLQYTKDSAISEIVTRSSEPLTDFTGYVLTLNGVEIQIPADGVIDNLEPGDYEVGLTNYPENYQPAFEDARYGGSKTVPVTAGGNTLIELELTQANAGLFFVYDESLLAEGFDDIIPAVRQGVNSLVYSGANKESKGYFAPGDVTITVEQDGRTVTIGGENSKTLQLSAQQLWQITLKALTSSTGELTITASVKVIESPTDFYEFELGNGTKGPGRLTGDITLPSNLTFAGILSWDSFQDDASLWRVNFGTEGIETDGETFTGSGHAFSFELYTPKGSRRLTRGYYYPADSPEEFGFIPGTIENGEYKGCWYFEYEDGKIITHAPAVTGSIYVSTKDAAVPTFSIAPNFFDDQGYKVFKLSTAALLEIPVKPEYPDIVFTEGGYAYWGDKLTAPEGLGEYFVTLQNTSVNGASQKLGFSLYTDLADPINETYIQPMVYEIKPGKEYNSILSGRYEYSYYDFVMFNYVSGMSEAEYIAEGTVDISYEGETCIIKMDMINNWGDVVRAEYAGVLEVTNWVVPPVHSTLGGDSHTDFVEQSVCEIYYRGYDLYETMKYWIVEVWEPTVSLDGNTWVGNGDIFQMMICTSMDYDTDNIPLGTYTISDYEGVGNMLRGGVRGIYPAQSWFYRLTNDVAKEAGPLHEGSATFSMVGDKYRMEMDFLDDAGNKVTGVYEGDWTAYGGAYGMSPSSDKPQTLHRIR